jgi:hypothetical protein
MKQLHKRAYHNGNLEATKLAWNAITALPPIKGRTLGVEAADIPCVYKFKAGDT